VQFQDVVAQQWARYERLNDKEQLLVIVLFFLLIAGFLFFVVVQPLQTAKQSAENRYTQELKLQQQLHSLDPQKKVKQSGVDTNQSLLAIVNSTTATLGISLKRVEPKNNELLRVWIEQVSFNQLMVWLAALENEYNIKLDSISLDKSETAGTVNTALVLAR